MPAGLCLILVGPPHDGDVEINPEEDVDDEEGNERLRDIRNVAPTSFKLEPDITPQYQANALGIVELIRMMQHNSNCFTSFLDDPCCTFYISGTAPLKFCFSIPAIAGILK